MRLSDEIRIIDLLAMREAEFLRVRDCEAEIAAILGGAAFPFPAPGVKLPSEGRSSRSKSWSPRGIPVPSRDKGRGRGAAVAENPAAALLRPLREPEENAYRVVYRDKDGIRVSYHLESAAILEMMSLKCESFAVDCVETVRFENIDDFCIIERLWKREGAEDDVNPEL